MTVLMLAAACAATPVAAHQLLDRVVARIGTGVIMWTDVEAARGLGALDVPAGPAGDRLAVERMIDRQLMLREVARFPPPEPEQASIEARAAILRRYAGADLERLMRTTGIGDAQIRGLARDDLRIEAYLDQRFGLAVQVTDDEVRRYYEANPDEFTRNGAPEPFEQVEGLARQRLAAQRRAAVVGNWLRDLRSRTDVVVVFDG